MRKRNKIRLPSLNDEDVPAKNDDNGKSNVEMLQDDFNEEPLPILGGLKKMGKIPIETTEKTEEKNKYGDLFKKDAKVLNLENIESDSDVEQQPRESFKPKDTFREKDYAKLLNKEEKREILDHFKKFGGSADSDEDDPLQEFQDERLVLSHKEQRLHDARKKKLIQDVIAQDFHSDGSSREWEANLMNRVQIQSGPILPSCYKGAIDGNALEEKLTDVQQQKKQLKTKLALLQNQRHKLQGKRQELVTKIKQLGAC